jgi:hypothetical protein
VVPTTVTGSREPVASPPACQPRRRPLCLAILPAGPLSREEQPAISAGASCVTTSPSGISTARSRSCSGPTTPGPTRGFRPNHDAQAARQLAPLALLRGLGIPLSKQPAVHRDMPDIPLFPGVAGCSKPCVARDPAWPSCRPIRGRAGAPGRAMGTSCSGCWREGMARRARGCNSHDTRCNIRDADVPYSLGLLEVTLFKRVWSIAVCQARKPLRTRRSRRFCPFSAFFLTDQSGTVTKIS